MSPSSLGLERQGEKDIRLDRGLLLEVPSTLEALIDLHNLLSNYGGTPRDIETELSTAAISSQSFAVPNIPFKPACSNEVGINEAGVLGNGLWANQTQRMRTFTKVCYAIYSL